VVAWHNQGCWYRAGFANASAKPGLGATVKAGRLNGSGGLCPAAASPDGPLNEDEEIVELLGSAVAHAELADGAVWALSAEVALDVWMSLIAARVASIRLKAWEGG